MADDKTEQALEACQDAVEELKVQNEELREAATTAGIPGTRPGLMNGESDDRGAYSCGKSRTAAEGATATQGAMV
jgi:hypothetical protein